MCLAVFLCCCCSCFFFFFFNDTATTEIYTLSLHDALPIFEEDERKRCRPFGFRGRSELVQERAPVQQAGRSEEHTSELQSRRDLVCRLLLEKKKKKKKKTAEKKNRRDHKSKQ